MKNEIKEEKTNIQFVPNPYGGLPDLFIEHAQTIYFRNFAGNLNDKFNKPNIGSINIIIPEEYDDLISQLTDVGWNVKISTPKKTDDGEETREHYIPCLINWDNEDRPPEISMMTGGKMIKVTPRIKNRLEELYITNIDVTLHPYDYRNKYPDAAGPGIKAYVKKMVVSGEADPMTQKYAAIASDGAGDMLNEDVPF